MGALPTREVSIDSSQESPTSMLVRFAKDNEKSWQDPDALVCRVFSQQY